MAFSRTNIRRPNNNNNQQQVGGGNNAASIPVFIADGETFSVKENTQVLFDETIESEGLIDLDGLLTEVE